MQFGVVCRAHAHVSERAAAARSAWRLGRCPRVGKGVPVLAAGQAGPRLAGPASCLRQLGQGASGAGWAEAKGERMGRRGGAGPG